MKRLQICSLALLMAVPTICAQKTFNIERVYKHMTTANGATQARQGVYANGKFYIHNWIGQTVEVWDQDGQMVETFESKGTGPGITADAAGNIMIENTDNPWPEASGQTRYYRIFKGGANDPVDIEVTYDGLRDSETGMRCDYFGPIDGDVMSAQGGTFACMVQHRPVINVVKIANGAPIDNFSIYVDTAFVNGNVVCNVGYDESTMYKNWETNVVNGAAYSQVTCFKYNDQYVMSKMMVGLKGYTYDPTSKGSHEVETEAYKGILARDYTTVYDPTYNMGDAQAGTYMSGGRIFEMGGRRYVIENAITKNESANMNTFAIYDDETGRTVGLWYGFENKDYDRAVTACASWFTVIPVSDKSAEIYQYFPAEGAGRAYIAKYVFSLD